MDYTLHQLRIFLKVVEKKSITQAANELFLTQPAVSIQLKKFQDQFDTPLIEVIGRQVHITEFGKEIAKTGQKIIDQVQEIRNKALAYKGLLAGRLKIAVVSTGKYVMPFFLAEFLQKHPGIDLKMDVTNKTQVLENLRKNEVDFALVSVLPENLKIDQIELMENKLFLVRKYSEADKATTTSLKALEKQPLIFREKGSATRRAMELFIEGLNFPVRKSIELTSNEAVKQAVLAGLGWSVMPLIGIMKELANKELEIVKIKGLPITTHWNLIWLKDKELSAAASAYSTFVRDQKDSLIRKHFEGYGSGL